jgi:SET domain-containing protein
MIRVPVYLKPSSIHGTGVFAARDIPKGETVWYFARALDRAIPEHVWVRASEQEKDKLFERGFRYADNPEVIFMCGDEGQFLNFPMPEEQSNLVLGPVINEHPVLMARHDIRAREELTVPPESDADFERKTGKHLCAQRPTITEMPSIEDLEKRAAETEPEDDGLPRGIRDGEDVS